MPRSLAARFFVASLLILPILMGASVYMLNLAFKRSLLAGIEERLATQALLVLAVTEVTENGLEMPATLPEPRLNQSNSGLYAYIYSDDFSKQWQSPSTLLLDESKLFFEKNPVIPNSSQFISEYSSDVSLFKYNFDFAWEIDENDERLYRLTIFFDQAPFLAELNSYRNQLWRWLGLIGVLIVISQALILRWGLRPLKILAKDLKDVESGKATVLEGVYPNEIQAVTNNLNTVLNSERNQRERYRNTLDDLAHSLKTPLAVIQSSLQQGSDKELVAEQVDRMNKIVGHQLKRAVIKHSNQLGEKINILVIASRIITTLQKVYKDKNITANVDVETGITFRADEQDLFELFGNIFENAFKYCKRQIQIHIFSNDSFLIIEVSDDGEGVPESKREMILQRGARADTAAKGQGIGLTVAIEIISSYQGSLSISESTLGGATFTIQLPLN